MRGSDKSFTPWMKKVWGDGTGVPVPPNLGGERTVRKKSPPKPRAEVADAAAAADGGGMRRALLIGLLAQPAFFLGAQTLSGGMAKPLPAAKEKKLVESRDSYLDGDAVTAPALEIELLELLEEEESGPARDAKVTTLVAALEERGGTQIFASAGSGRWVLPWVGAWERVWTNSSDSSFLGGPARTSFQRKGVALEQVSARQFVYGPGEGGMVIEYLSAYQGDETAPIKFLLTRPGTVTNLGENVFRLDFPTALDEYEVFYDKTKGRDRLANCVETLNADGSPTGLLNCQPTDGGAERGGPAGELLVRTTYLSERFWIQRDARDASRVVVLTRTETRSVMDRRGLVADGQLKPSDDEATRYGKLLFGESIQDYSGWDAQQTKMMQEKNKLLSK